MVEVVSPIVLHEFADQIRRYNVVRNASGDVVVVAEAPAPPSHSALSGDSEDRPPYSPRHRRQGYYDEFCRDRARSQLSNRAKLPLPTFTKSKIVYSLPATMALCLAMINVTISDKLKIIVSLTTIEAREVISVMTITVSMAITAGATTLVVMT